MTDLDDASMDLLRAWVGEPGPGDVLDHRYELREWIGEGAMGAVYAAWDGQTQDEVAIKLVRHRDEQTAERFAREAVALGRVGHPAVVAYLGHGRSCGAEYLVMQRLVGSTLAERLAAGPLALTDTLALGRRIAGGLAAVHHAGLTHRDVKPSNIYLVEDSAAGARLLDFGLACGRDAARLTATGALVGTPGYMAPEQVRGEHDIGPAADVFALGCVLFECLTGRAAFVAQTTEALLSKILLEEPPAVRELSPALPLRLAELVKQMLEKSPADRPDAAHVEAQLQALEADQPTESAHEGPPGVAAPSPAAGEVVAGKYRIEGPLGEGGMGVVLSAKHLELGKRVALKLLRAPRPSGKSGGPSATAGDRQEQARLLREAQAAALLESEHVARVLDVGRLDEGTPFIVMEHLRGQNLAQRLAEQGPLAIEQAVGYVLEACEAIAEAHALGIVHRDLKPSNLFVTSRRDGKPLIKVLDFGISKLTRPLEGSDDAALSMTGPAAVLGSASYMSPEQLRHSRDVDTRTDIWSLGVVLHELIAGTPPFVADSPAAVGALIAADEPARLCDSASQAPAELEAVILRCLEKDPQQRFADVGELAAALLPFGGEGAAAAVERVQGILKLGVAPSGADRAVATAGAAVPTSVTAARVRALRRKSQQSRRLKVGVLALALVAATVLVARLAEDQERPQRAHTGLGDGLATGARLRWTTSADRDTGPASQPAPATLPDAGTSSDAGKRAAVFAPTAAPGAARARPSETPPQSPAASAPALPAAASARPVDAGVDLFDPALSGR